MRADAEEIGIHFLFHELIAGTETNHGAIKMLNTVIEFETGKLVEEMIFLHRKFTEKFELSPRKAGKIMLNAVPVRIALPLHPEVENIIALDIRLMLQRIGRDEGRIG